MWRSFDLDVVPELRALVAKAVTPEQVKKVLYCVEVRNSHEICRRLAGRLNAAFHNARIKPNPMLAENLGRFKRQVKFLADHAEATSSLLRAQVLRTIDVFAGPRLMRGALLVNTRLFVRPDELRLASWSQVRSDQIHSTMMLEDGPFQHLLPQAQACLSRCGLFTRCLCCPERATASESVTQPQGTFCMSWAGRIYRQRTASENRPRRCSMRWSGRHAWWTCSCHATSRAGTKMRSTT